MNDQGHHDPASSKVQLSPRSLRDSVVLAEVPPIDRLHPLNRVSITQNDLESLAELGVFVRSTGINDVSRGSAVVNQQMLQRTIQSLAVEVQKLSAKARKTREDLTCMAQLAQAQSRLAAQLTTSQEFLSGSQDGQEDMDADRPLVKTFAPGEIVPTSRAYAVKAAT